MSEADGATRRRRAAERVTQPVRLRSAATPVRVRVTSPRMAAATRPQSRPPGREIDEQTDLGEIYMRSLLRTQLRLGVSVLVAVGVCLAALPVLFALEPRLAGVRILTVPLPWLIVGVAVYPLMLGAAWWLVRTAERNERDFSEIVERD